LGVLTYEQPGDPGRTDSYPPQLKQWAKIVFDGAIRWPREWGKVRILRIEFFRHHDPLNVDVTQNETSAQVVDTDGVLSFESLPMKAPVNFTGKSTIRIWASVNPPTMTRIGRSAERQRNRDRHESHRD
jgi:hypothetical protein